MKTLIFTLLLVLATASAKLYGGGVPELIAAGPNFQDISRLLGNELVNTVSTCDGWTVITTRTFVFGSHLHFIVSATVTALPKSQLLPRASARVLIRNFPVKHDISVFYIYSKANWNDTPTIFRSSLFRKKRPR
jgi:hypothetical protein